MADDPNVAPGIGGRKRRARKRPGSATPRGRATAPGQLKKLAGAQSARAFAPGRLQGGDRGYQRPTGMKFQVDAPPGPRPTAATPVVGRKAAARPATPVRPTPAPGQKVRPAVPAGQPPAYGARRKSQLPPGLARQAGQPAQPRPAAPRVPGSMRPGRAPLPQAPRPMAGRKRRV